MSTVYTSGNVNLNLTSDGVVGFNGSITIKQLALFYYYDSDNNLVMPDKDWTTTGANMKDWEDGNIKGFNDSCYNETATPTAGQKYKYKLFETYSSN